MLLDELLKVGFLTGSRAFGTNRPNSDYDVVYAVDDTAKIDRLLVGLVRTPSNYFAGYYVTTPEMQINLIPVHARAYFPWYLTTEAFKATAKLAEFRDPQHKYAVFAGMVALYSATLPNIGGSASYRRQRERLRTRGVTSFEAYAALMF